MGPGWIGRPELGLEDRPLSEKEIQKAAYNFLPGTPLGSPFVDVQHDFIKQAEVVESFITSGPYDFNGITYPPGTWFLTSKITNPEIIEGVRNGTYTGYSVSAWPENQRQRLEQKINEGQLIAKGLFSNVKEGEWFPLAVSIAKMPFYPEAVFKVFETDEFIKKNIPDQEVGKLSEEKNALFRVIDKLLDNAINKEVKAEDAQTIMESPKFVTEEMLDSKLDGLLNKVKDLVEASQAEEETEETEETEEVEEEAETTEAEAETTETESEEDSTEEEAEEVETEEALISKAIKIDEVKAEKKGNRGFLADCGCDPLGRNPKYL